MENIRQIVSKEGLNIPLPLIERYGLQPGKDVVLQLGIDGIRILPALPNRENIENKALRLLLSNLGDATTVQAFKTKKGWQVVVFGAGLSDALGYLYYSLDGELKTEISTSFAEMRQKAIALFQRS